MEFELGEVIADRVLQVEYPDGETSKAVVYLGKSLPMPNAPYGDYYTPYQIDFGGHSKLRHAAGIDGFQSLQLAMKMINVELDVLQKDMNVKISWVGRSDGTLGFAD